MCSSIEEVLEIKTERFENSGIIAEKKLVLLYMLSILKEGVNNVELTKIVLEGRYMDFFTMQQYLNELIDKGYVSSSVIDGIESPKFIITNSGRELLHGMLKLLPTIEKNRVDRTFGPIRKSVRAASAVTSDYMPDSEDRYVARLRIKENEQDMIYIEIAAGSKDDARLICQNWERAPNEMYSRIVNILTDK
ncbi:MAG: DUF4364 family protein [Oscillospiraceae bacterium]|nr:DUF4364 family protein [Oscillospiraceae bacterium]